ncbi:MAG: LacI family DNA-binding transcriptional regulator [Phycisphaerae bacterium]
MTILHQRGRLTLKDIATELGVSKSTVAQVLNQHPDCRVSPKVRSRVSQFAKAAGYQPSHMAKALRTGRTNLIGLIIPNIYFMTHPGFYHTIYGSILESVSKSDNAVVNLLTEPFEKLHRLVDQDLLDGLFVMTSDPDNGLIDFLADTGLPMVVVNREVTHREVSFVTQNYRAAGAETVNALVNAGHRRLALLAIEHRTANNQCLIRSFQEQVKSLASQGVSGTWFNVIDNKEESYRQVAQEVVRSGPFDAYIVDVLQLAQVLREVAAEAGQAIGQKKDLIVFNTVEEDVSGVVPWKLYLHQNELVGQQAYRILIDRIEGRQIEPQKCYTSFKVIENE